MKQQPTVKQQNFSYFAGLFLILLGSLAFLQAVVLPLFGWHLQLWRLWPLVLVAGSLFMLLAPFIWNSNAGLKGLFIPGFPLLTISSMLLVGSIFNGWGVWATFWPAILVALALGFATSAVFMRNIWLLIPAVIIGTNGLMFQFSALTGWWGAWAIFWTIEPLAVGLALLITSAGHRRELITAGLILAAISFVLFSVMSLALSGWVSVLGASLLIFTGTALLVQGRRSSGQWQAVNPADEELLPQEKIELLDY